MKITRKPNNNNSHNRKISRRCTNRYLQCKQCSQYKQYKQSSQEPLQVYKKEDKSVFFTNDLKAATERSVAFVILR